MRGVVVPWFDGGRLALVKIRQPEGGRARYAEAFRDRPVLLSGAAGEPGQPLVVVEGEFDALLVGQELRGWAAVVTLGSASSRPEATTLADLAEFSPWLIATDADQAGDQTAAAWPKKARRVRPPAMFKDWTEAAAGGVNLARWWADRLAGVEELELFTWAELSAQRWGDDPEPGIDVLAEPWEEDLAGWPIDQWLEAQRRATELAASENRPEHGPTVRAGNFRWAQSRAYSEISGREKAKILEEGGAYKV